MHRAQFAFVTQGALGPGPLLVMRDTVVFRSEVPSTESSPFLGSGDAARFVVVDANVV